MCLGIPAKVIRVENDRALVSIGEIEYEANIGLLEEVKPGDYIILHTGFGIEKVNEAEAAETMRLIREIEQGLPEKQDGTIQS
ncbi:MAG: HypC/HybG/HupF family hydrogenase formation chaperone [Bacteroidales bacterium]|nr:HypC/HybG/HupF family hydrogenase formation chaperone [Bacteroidales bacterium]